MCHSSLSGHIRDIIAHIFTLVAFMLHKLVRKNVYLRVVKSERITLSG